MTCLTDLPVLVINLDRRPDRWAHIQKMLAMHGFSRVQRLSAVDGQKLSEDEVSRVTSPEARSSLTRIRYRHEELGSVGAVGCYLSHVKVWQIIASSPEPYLVVEDDAVLLSSLMGFAVAQNPLAACQGYDMVLLGYLLLRSLDGKRSPQNSTNQDQIVPYRGLFFGTQFYYLTPSGAQKLLERALPIEVQVDSYMGQQMVEGHVVTGAHFPNLGWQRRADDTDIQVACLEKQSPLARRQQKRLWIFLVMIIVVLLLIFWIWRRKRVRTLPA